MKFLYDSVKDFKNYDASLVVKISIKSTIINSNLFRLINSLKYFKVLFVSSLSHPFLTSIFMLHNVHNIQVQWYIYIIYKWIYLYWDCAVRNFLLMGCMNKRSLKSSDLDDWMRMPSTESWHLYRVIPWLFIHSYIPPTAVFLANLCVSSSQQSWSHHFKELLILRVQYSSQENGSTSALHHPISTSFW